MTIAKKISSDMAQASWIRKMFDEGARLKAEHGPESVFDFSLGNPSLPTPDRFIQALYNAIEDSNKTGHNYMPQPGYLHIRKAVADYLGQEQGVGIQPEDVIMTCGAAGALNTIFKALLDPEDEVIVPTPCFVEYRFYVDNHGGVIRYVSTRDDFTLDLDAIASAITAKTKAVLINFPNNPTGQIYSQASLDQLGELLDAKSKMLKRTIYLISDEPYRKIVFDDRQMPTILSAYEQSILATSYSKDLSLAGERIGYAAVHPAATCNKEIMAAMALAIRILGFINAPALMQRTVGKVQGLSVDIDAYRKKRDLLCKGLADAGYQFEIPAGTFYLFVKTPIEDDVAFVRELQKELILTVPGSGFVGPGYMRISFCVHDATIVNAMPGFKRVMASYK